MHSDPFTGIPRARTNEGSTANLHPHFHRHVLGQVRLRSMWLVYHKLTSDPALITDASCQLLPRDFQEQKKGVWRTASIDSWILRCLLSNRWRRGEVVCNLYDDRRKGILRIALFTRAGVREELLDSTYNLRLSSYCSVPSLPTFHLSFNLNC